MSDTPRIGSRREARETALGILYEADVRDESVADALAHQVLEPPPYAAALLRGLAEHLDEVDVLLRRYARDWALERMPVIDPDFAAIIERCCTANPQERFASAEALGEAPGHPHNVARQTFVEVAGVMQPNVAPRFLGTPTAVQGPPPAIGAHGAEVLADWGVKAKDPALG